METGVEFSKCNDKLEHSSEMAISLSQKDNFEKDLLYVDFRQR